MVAFVGLICVAKMYNLSWKLAMNQFHPYASTQVSFDHFFFYLFNIFVLIHYLTKFSSNIIFIGIDVGNENVIYVSTGKEVKCFDVHMVILFSFDYLCFHYI